MAVVRPRSGVTPEAMAIAIDKGNATIATVRPAMTSARKSARRYPSRNTVTSFGVNSSAKVGCRIPWIRSSAMLTAPAPVASRGRRQRGRDASIARTARWSRLFQADATPALFAACVLADQLDTRAIERIDHLHQRIDDAAHRALAGLHPLDGGQRHPGHRSQRPLIDAQERARC